MARGTRRPTVDIAHTRGKLGVPTDRKAFDSSALLTWAWPFIAREPLRLGAPDRVLDLVCDMGRDTKPATRVAVALLT